jgi:hypothetical protein
MVENPFPANFLRSFFHIWRFNSSDMDLSELGAAFRCAVQPRRNLDRKKSGSSALKQLEVLD